jgi:hypothetical protein
MIYEDEPIEVLQFLSLCSFEFNFCRLYDYAGLCYGEFML